MRQTENNMTDGVSGFVDMQAAPELSKAENSRRERGTHFLKDNNGLKVAIDKAGRLVSLEVPVARGRRINVIARPPKAGPLTASCGSIVINDSATEMTCFFTTMYDRFVGYPQARIRYSVGDNNRLKITYEATPEQMTVLNFGRNLFFNLNGSGGILNHLVKINSDICMPVSGDTLASPQPVAGTPFDFRKATTIGARINDYHEQLRNGRGYKHVFVTNKHSSKTPVARIKGDKTGVIMEVCTEETDLLFCTGNAIHASFPLTVNNDHCGFTFAPSQLYLPRETPAIAQAYKISVVYRFPAV